MAPSAPEKRPGSGEGKGRRRRLTRRRFLFGSLAWLVAGDAALLGYTWSPRITRREVWLPNLPKGWDGARVLHVTDFHRSKVVPSPALRKMLRRARSLPHDLAVLTGDYVSDNKEYIHDVAGMLRGWHPPLGTWAVLGNHDHWEGHKTITRALEGVGVPVLSNRSVRLTRGGDRIRLAGVDDPFTFHADITQALRGNREGCTLLLAHSPDILGEAAMRGVDLVLSGHTHGGQICQPGGRAITVPTELGPDYAAGLFRRDATQMYVNRGLGVIVPPFRLFCPPEIALLTLRGGVEPGE